MTSCFRSHFENNQTSGCVHHSISTNVYNSTTKRKKDSESRKLQNRMRSERIRQGRRNLNLLLQNRMRSERFRQGRRNLNLLSNEKNCTSATKPYARSQITYLSRYASGPIQAGLLCLHTAGAAGEVAVQKGQKSDRRRRRGAMGAPSPCRLSPPPVIPTLNFG